MKYNQNKKISQYRNMHDNYVTGRVADNSQSFEKQRQHEQAHNEFDYLRFKA